MPRRKKTKTARTATRSVAGGKTITKKTKANPAGLKKFRRKDIRFSVSLVILIAMLAFSAMLLLLSLNKSAARSAGAGASKAAPAENSSGLRKTEGRVIDDVSLDFKVTVPAELGAWFYKTGEVKSLTDDSLSDQYFRIFVPLAGTKSNNFDRQNKEILTIRKFSLDEWADITKGCQKEKKDICDAAGELIAKTSDSKGNGWVYACTKPADCPKSIEAKCALADKIIESFSLK